jgi:hypothetical protein
MRSLEMRFKEADLVIYCALPLLTCFYRIFYRSFAWYFFGKERPDCPEGSDNYVTFRLLKYVWNFSSKYNPMIYALKDNHPHVEFIPVHSKKDLESILKRFTKKASHD